MTVRDKETSSETSEFLKRLAHLSTHLTIDRDIWDGMLEDAKTQLEGLTREAIRSTDLTRGLSNSGYMIRAQELTIRLDILEEFVHQLPPQPD